MPAKCGICGGFHNLGACPGGMHRRANVQPGCAANPPLPPRPRKPGSVRRLNRQLRQLVRGAAGMGDLPGLPTGGRRAALISRGYEIHLYCDCLECKRGGFRAAFAVFTGESWRDTSRQARKAGWRIAAKRSHAWAPSHKRRKEDTTTA